MERMLFEAKGPRIVADDQEVEQVGDINAAWKWSSKNCNYPR
jgi:hypothetical protein